MRVGIQWESELIQCTSNQRESQPSPVKRESIRTLILSTIVDMQGGPNVIQYTSNRKEHYFSPVNWNLKRAWIRSTNQQIPVGSCPGDPMFFHKLLFDVLKNGLTQRSVLLPENWIGFGLPWIPTLVDWIRVLYDALYIGLVWIGVPLDC